MDQSVSSSPKMSAGSGRVGLREDAAADLLSLLSLDSGSRALDERPAAAAASTPMIKLYGGSFGFMLPERFIDVSQFRIVPDHQEVFIDSECDQSVIVEVVDRQTCSNKAAPEFFFEDLAESAEATSFTLEQKGELGADRAPFRKQHDFPCLFALGRQSISKFKDDVSRANEVAVCLIIVRLVNVDSDLLITINSPVAIAPGSKSEGCRIAPKQSFDSVISSVISSFQINNFAIFPSHEDSSSASSGAASAAASGPSSASASSASAP